MGIILIRLLQTVAHSTTHTQIRTQHHTHTHQFSELSHTMQLCKIHKQKEADLTISQSAYHAWASSSGLLFWASCRAHFLIPCLLVDPPLYSSLFAF